MNYSFFYAAGGSGYIRGKQMADYLGGKHNPTEGYENDVCIYVKKTPPDGYPKHTVMDVDDAPRAVEWLKTHTDTGVIAISLTAKEYLEKVLNRKDIVFIPHQHINFDRYINPVREVKVVGIIGSITSFQYPIDDLRAKLLAVGLELRYEPEYWKTYKDNPKQDMRHNIIDFHKEMDIQIVWRPHGFSAGQDPLRNPNKLGNASSFGIPTVSYPEKSYIREWEGCFIPANTIDDLVGHCRLLKEDRVYYDYFSKKALERSEQYHIEKIAELYRAL